MSTHADLEVFMDMMGDNVETPFNVVIEKDKENHYYTGLGLNILKQFDNDEKYFHFLLSIVKNFDKLDDSFKEKIKTEMKIVPKTIIQEKIVYKEKPQTTTTKKKAKLNMGYSNKLNSDDY